MEALISNQNVEIVHRIYGEINLHREFPREWFDPDCVTDWTQVAPDGGLYRGVDAANVAVASYFGTFEDFHSRPKTSCTPIRSVWSRSSATAGGLEVATER